MIQPAAWTGEIARTAAGIRSANAIRAKRSNFKILGSIPRIQGQRQHDQSDKAHAIFSPLHLMMLRERSCGGDHKFESARKIMSRCILYRDIASADRKQIEA